MKLKNKLWLLFIVIGLLKIITSFFPETTFIYGDEGCITIIAREFIRNLQYFSCTEVMGIRSGEPQPLYSLLISPIYAFTDGFTAYRLVLILNALITSSLVFPIYGLIKKLGNNEKNSLLLTAIICILPVVSVYEKTLMTETLYLVLSVWMLFFYAKSFEKNKKRNKVISIILSLLITITRPFGFIAPIAIAANEIIQLKLKTTYKLGFSIIFTIVAILAIYLIVPIEIINSLIEGKLGSLINGETKNWMTLGKAFIQQFNSLLIGSFFIPAIFFFKNIDSKNQYFKNITGFLISFIVLNFLISAQHLYGYLLGSVDPNLITRYINVSIFYITLCGLALFAKETTENKSKDFKTLFYGILLMIPFIFFQDLPTKLTLNLDLGYFYQDHKQIGYTDNSYSKEILGTGLLVASIFITCCHQFWSKKLSYYTTIILITACSLFSIHWISNFAYKRGYSDYLSSLQNKVITVVTNQDFSPYKNFLFHFHSIADIEMRIIQVANVPSNTLDVEKISNQESFKKADFIISKYELDLPVILITKDLLHMYKIKED